MSKNILTVKYGDREAPAQFTRSLKETGFAVLSSHPIQAALIESVYADWQGFFADEVKFNYRFDPEKQDGFFPFGTENAKGSAQKDLKEFYHLYPWGRWPSEMGGSTRTLYDNLVSLTSELLEWIQDNTPDEIRNGFSVPLPDMLSGSERNLLRIIHYPALTGDEEAGAIRAAAHEDINLITLLVAGTEPGLQVLDLNGSWHDVECDPGTIVVNTGDMLQMVSDRYFPSTTHQVINPGGAISNGPRYSMPLFLHPRDDVALSDAHTAGSYLEERLSEIGLKS